MQAPAHISSVKRNTSPVMVRHARQGSCPPASHVMLPSKLASSPPSSSAAVHMSPPAGLRLARSSSFDVAASIQQSVPTGHFVGLSRKPRPACTFAGASSTSPRGLSSCFGSSLRSSVMKLPGSSAQPSFGPSATSVATAHGSSVCARAAALSPTRGGYPGASLGQACGSCSHRACVEGRREAQSLVVARGGATAPCAASPNCSSARHQPERLEAGAEVAVGRQLFRCLSLLGKGSFSEVWRSHVVGGQGEIALKEVFCKSQQDLQSAVQECTLLLNLHQALGATGIPQDRSTPRAPLCLGYTVDPFKRGWRVRMAMTRILGEPLDRWGQSVPSLMQSAVTSRRPSSHERFTHALRRGCALAMQLILQIGLTLERLAPLAFHRDVNSHNILMGDTRGPDGSCVGLAGICDPSEVAHRVSFCLIDFGLAVKSKDWASPGNAWKKSTIAGDCRYWPAGAWLAFLFGVEALALRLVLCRQYTTRLDIHGIAITAIELLCTTIGSACPGSSAAGSMDFNNRESAAWSRLLASWHRYRTDVWSWHSQVYEVFLVGGNIEPVMRRLGQEGVVDLLLALLAELRTGLRACAACCMDSGSRCLLSVLAEMIDESSTLGLREAALALEQDVTQRTMPSQLTERRQPDIPFSAATHVAAATWAKVARRVQPSVIFGGA